MKVVARLALAVGAVLAVSAPAFAQIKTCKELQEQTTNQPPAGSAPVYRCAQILGHAAGDRNAEVELMIDPYTYAGRLTAAWSLVDRNQWKPYDETIIDVESWRALPTGSCK